MKSLRTQSGVTLVELVMLIIVMAIIIPPLASGFSTSGKMVSIKKNLQLAITESEACAEHILGIRRKMTYADVISGTSNILCDSITETAEFSAASLTRTLDIYDIVNGAYVLDVSDPNCPVNCKNIYVRVTRSGDLINEIQFMFVDY